jgi:hypothetical protein
VSGLVGRRRTASGARWRAWENPLAGHPSEKNSWGRLESRRACFATRMAPIASGCLEIPDMAAFQELMQADPSWEATRADGVSRRYGGVPRGGVTRHRLSVRPRTALTFKA